MTIEIELIHPKVKALIQELAMLNLIKIKKPTEQNSVEGILKLAGVLTLEEADEMNRALNDAENIDHGGW